MPPRRRAQRKCRNDNAARGCRGTRREASGIAPVAVHLQAIPPRRQRNAVPRNRKGDPRVMVGRSRLATRRPVRSRRERGHPLSLGRLGLRRLCGSDWFVGGYGVLDRLDGDDLGLSPDLHRFYPQTDSATSRAILAPNGGQQAAWSRKLELRAALAAFATRSASCPAACTYSASGSRPTPQGRSRGGGGPPQALREWHLPPLALSPSSS
jgi:hypothetical protein